MKKIEKLFIVAGLVIILLVSGGIYMNNKLNRLFDNAAFIGVVLTEKSPVKEEAVVESSLDEKPAAPRPGQIIKPPPGPLFQQRIY